MKLTFFTKLQLPPEPLSRGLPPPDPRSLCPLSLTEFVEPPPPRKKFLGTPLIIVVIIISLFNFTSCFQLHFLATLIRVGPKNIDLSSLKCI